MVVQVCDPSDGEEEMGDSGKSENSRTMKPGLSKKQKTKHTKPLQNQVHLMEKYIHLVG